MRAAALIVAAGIGTRAGAGLPKQYRPLGGVAVLRRTVSAMLASPDISAVQVVIGAKDRAHYDTAMDGLSDPRLLAPITGGTSRRASVQNGLEALASNPPDLVLIHDAARPLLSLPVIERVLAALGTHQAALPALPANDALWLAADGFASAPQSRADIWQAQTPQGFHFDAILKAHCDFTGEADDDIAIARAAGIAAKIVPGDPQNFKLTEAADFTRAARILEGNLDIRTGNGFDVHALGPGDHVMLCGVRVDHPHGLIGHSDADVAMHALTDALFGALAEGDIGQWFPPSEAEWKGAASSIFLAKAMERVAARGFKVSNLDCTIICEAPKIGPHATAMRTSIAHLTGIAEDRISVKATTTEKLGFTGRGEGIAALANATLVSG